MPEVGGSVPVPSRPGGVCAGNRNERPRRPGFIGTDEGPDAEGGGGSGETKYDLGTIIGKCENFLVITLILADALTGLALVFTAKSIVRADGIKRNPRYYLGGTVVNFTYSVFIGFAIKVILAATGHSL